MASTSSSSSSSSLQTQPQSDPAQDAAALPPLLPASADQARSPSSAPASGDEEVPPPANDNARDNHHQEAAEPLAPAAAADVDPPAQPPPPHPDPPGQAPARPANEAAAAAAARLRAFKLVYFIGTGIPHTLFLIFGFILLATQKPAVPSDQCEPSIRINLIIDMGISLLLALSTFYVYSFRRQRRRKLRMAILFAWISKMSINFMQISDVFGADSKCKPGDKVFWTALAFRICLFFGVIAGYANARIGEISRPRSYRARDSVFLELWGVFNLVLIGVIAAVLLLYDAPALPDPTDSGSAPNNTVSNTLFSTAADANPTPSPLYCEQSVPAYLYFETIASIAVLVPFFLNAWVRFVKRLDAWEFRTKRFASLELRTGFLVSMGLKVATLVVGARAVIPSRPVCAEYDPQLLLFARIIVGIRAGAFIPFVICYYFFKGAVVEHPLNVESNAAEERKRAAIERCTTKFTYTPEAVAQTLQMAVAARRADVTVVTTPDPVAPPPVGHEDAIPMTVVSMSRTTSSTPVDRGTPTPRGHSPLFLPSPLHEQHYRAGTPSSAVTQPSKPLDVLDRLGIPSSSYSSHTSLDLTPPRGSRTPSHRSLAARSRASSFPRRPPSAHSAPSAHAPNENGNDADEEEEDCPICYLPYEPSTAMLAMVRCGHAFHHDCLHAWLMRSEEREMRCPLCRTRAFEEDEGGGQGVENGVEA